MQTQLVDPNIELLRSERELSIESTYMSIDRSDIIAEYNTYKPNTLKILYKENVRKNQIPRTAFVELDQELSQQSWTYDELAVWDYIRTSLRHTYDIICKRLHPSHLTPAGWLQMNKFKLIGLASIRYELESEYKHKFWHSFVLLDQGMCYIAHSQKINDTKSKFVFGPCNYKELFDETKIYRSQNENTHTT